MRPVQALREAVRTLMENQGDDGPDSPVAWFPVDRSTYEELERLFVENLGKVEEPISPTSVP